MKTLKLSFLLLSAGLFLAISNLNAQCNVHPNFRSIANTSGLNSQYTIHVTIVSPRVSSHNYTAYGTGEICETRFQGGCKKAITLPIHFSDRIDRQTGQRFNKKKTDRQTITIDFVGNKLTRRLDTWGGGIKTHRNLQRKGNVFYVVESDGTVITLKMVKNATCLI